MTDIVKINQACDWPHCPCPSTEWCRAIHQRKTRAGNPCKHPTESEPMAIRVPTAMKKEFERRANLDNKNVSEYLRPILEQIIKTTKHDRTER